jgi:phosphoglycerate dehydrogenase-like enzyme
MAASEQGRVEVLIAAGGFDAGLLDRLRAISPRLHIQPAPPAGEVDGSQAEARQAAWARVEVLYTITRLPEPAEAPRLRWVQLHSAGAEHVQGHPLLAAGVRFTTASGPAGPTIAEYVFATLLARTRHVDRMLAWQARGSWPPDEQRWPLFVADELWGKTLGVVGYGSIGRQVARVGRAFGMRVLAMQRGHDHRDRGFVLPGAGDPDGSLAERFFTPERLAELLAESDVVVIALPLTAATRGLLDEAALRAMRPTAMLINVARGAIVQQAALVRALHEGWIGGAVLDVFEAEPLPPEHPLWQAPNVLLSPHVSAFGPSYDARMIELFGDNLRRYLAGEPLLNPVDPEAGY